MRNVGFTQKCSTSARDWADDESRVGICLEGIELLESGGKASSEDPCLCCLLIQDLATLSC